MTVTLIQQPDAISLSGNMKKIIVSCDGDVTMTLVEYPGQTENQLMVRTYSPDTDGMVTVDLGETIVSLLTVSVRNSSEPWQQTGLTKKLQVRFTTGSKTATTAWFTVVRGGIDQMADTAANFLRQNFLTWQPSTKGVTYWTPEFLTYYAQETVNVKCEATITSGNKRTVTLATIGAGQAWTVPVQYAVIAGKLNNQLPQYYDVWVEDQAGQRLTYIQRYYAQDMRSEQEEWVLFENSLGGIDTFRAYGESILQARHTHNMAETDDVAQEYRVDTERTYKKHTGRLDVRERRWLLDFFPSCGKYLYADNYLRRIVVTESDVQYKAGEGTAAYSFTYRFAEAKPYLNLPRTDTPLEVLDIEIPDVASFTVAPRLVELPRTQLSDGALFPVQDPYSEGWGTTTFGAIVSAVSNVIGTLIPDISSLISSKLDVTVAERDYLKKEDAAGTYLTKTAAADTYLTKAFFNKLFKVHAGADIDGTHVVLPNGDISDSGEYSIEAMFGFWTRQYLSALGKNDDEGGGGGGGGLDIDAMWDELGRQDATRQINASHLSDALLGYATQSYVANNYQPKGDYLTSITTQPNSGLDISPIIGGVSISLNEGVKTYIVNGNTAYGWGNHASQGYAEKSYVANNYLALAGGGIITSGDYALGVSERKLEFRYGNTAYGTIELDYGIDGPEFNISGNVTVGGYALWHAGNFTPHSHANKDVLDGITSALVGNWNTAYDYVVNRLMVLLDWFEADSNGDVKTKGNRGFYSNSFVSALGRNSSGSGGGGGMDIDAMWYELSRQDVTRVIDASHIPSLPYLSVYGGSLYGDLYLNSGTSLYQSYQYGDPSDPEYGTLTIEDGVITLDYGGRIAFGYGDYYINAGGNAELNSLTVNGSAVLTQADLTDYATQDWISQQGYLTPADVKHVNVSGVVPSSGTVAQAKAQIVTLIGSQQNGIGDTLTIPATLITEWDNESATVLPSSVYSMTKIGGGYSGSSYGQWLLSSYGYYRMGYVGRSNGQWTPLKWLVTTDDLAGYATTDALGSYLPKSGGTMTGAVKMSTNDIKLGYADSQMGEQVNAVNGILNNAGLTFVSSRSLTSQNTTIAAGSITINGNSVLTAADLTGYATQAWVNRQAFLTASALNGYAEQSWVGNNYQPKGTYVTSIATGNGLTGGTITGSGTIALSQAVIDDIGKGVTAYNNYLPLSAGSSKPLTGNLYLNTYGVYMTDANNYGTVIVPDEIRMRASGGGSTVLTTNITAGSITINGSSVLTSADLSGYLLKSGGTMTGELAFSYGGASTDQWLRFTASDNVAYLFGVRRPFASFGFSIFDGTNYYKIWHAGNLTSLSQLTNDSGYVTSDDLAGYLPLSGGTMTGFLYFPADRGVIFDIDSYIMTDDDDNGYLHINGYGAIVLMVDHSEVMRISGNGVSINGSDVVTSSALNNYLPLSGGTMTGAIRTNTNDIKLGYSGSGASEQVNMTNGILNNAGLTFISSRSLTSQNTTIAAGSVTINGNSVLTAADLTGYATQAWVNRQGFLTASALTGYATQSWVGQQGYVTTSALNGYATQSWVSQQGYLTSIIAQTDGGLDVSPITGGVSISLSEGVKTFIVNGNTAYGWGNHASQGYLKAADVKHVNIANTVSYNQTVGQAKSEIVGFLASQQDGVGDTLTLSASIILEWDNESTQVYPTSAYSLTKICGCYSGSSYGQWLLSTQGDSRLGYVGRSGNAWTPIRWLATTDDLSGYATTSMLGGYLPLTGGTLSGNLHVGGSVFLPADSSLTLDADNYIMADRQSNKVITGVTEAFDIKVYSSTVMSVDDDGVHATAYLNMSDARRKDIVRYDALPAFEAVANAPAIAYRWKDGDKNDTIQLGSIAQYWQKVLPGTVREGKDGYLSMQYDVTALLSAIATARRVQRHEERITELERENERLRMELEQLKAA